MTTSAAPAVSVGALVSDLMRDYDTLEVLDRVLHATADLTGADSTAILVPTAQRGLQVLAATSETARDLELFQVMSGVGPAFDCLRSQGTVVAPDPTAMAERWPEFAAAAEASSIGSVASVHMGLRGASLGALNIFGPTAPTEEHLRAVQALADVSVLALALSDHPTATAQHVVLQTLNRRVLLEEAKGVVAVWTGLPPNETGSLLLRYARTRGVLLADVAEQVVRLRLGADDFLAHVSAPAPR